MLVLKSQTTEIISKSRFCRVKAKFKTVNCQKKGIGKQKKTYNDLIIEIVEQTTFFFDNVREFKGD